MAPQLHPVCAQCAVPIEGEPITLGEEQFCCLGCVGGGPCLCDRPVDETLRLRVGPFATQEELLRFAAALEHAPGLLHVEMTHGDLQEARFDVVATNTEVLALAAEANPDHTIQVETNGTTVVARIVPPRRPRTTPAVDALLPTRTRFRVFRLPPETPTLEEGALRDTYQSPRPGDAHLPELPPVSTPAAPATTESQVAEMLSNTRPTSERRPSATAPEAYAPQPAPTPSGPRETPAQAVNPPTVATPRATPDSTPRMAVAPTDRGSTTTAVQAPVATAPVAVAQIATAPAPRPTPVAVADPPARPTQPPAAPRDETREVVIVASPFRSFLALNEFQARVRMLPGVRDTRVRRFYGGTLNLAVVYADAVPLSDRLRAVAGAPWTLVSATPDRVELVLSPLGSLAASRER